MVVTRYYTMCYCVGGAYLVATGNVQYKYVSHCFLSEEIKISREPTHIIDTVNTCVFTFQDYLAKNASGHRVNIILMILHIKNDNINKQQV